MSKCLLFGDGKYVEEYSSLVGACTGARAEAAARPGVRCVVKRDAIEVARYRMAGGQWIEAWVRGVGPMSAVASFHAAAQADNQLIAELRAQLEQSQAALARVTSDRDDLRQAMAATTDGMSEELRADDRRASEHWFARWREQNRLNSRLSVRVAHLEAELRDATHEASIAAPDRAVLGARAARIEELEARLAVAERVAQALVESNTSNGRQLASLLLYVGSGGR